MDDAPVNAGKYKVVVTVEADTNYHSASVEKEFIISKAESTFIIHDALDKQYDGQSIQIPRISHVQEAKLSQFMNGIYKTQMNGEN